MGKWGVLAYVFYSQRIFTIMATLFTKILNHEIPGHFVYEDEQCGVFLSIAPLRQGHLLVVPRHEADHWIDLTEEEAGHCFKIAQRLGKVLMRAFKPRKIGLMIAGLEVPHAHVHVVPIQDESALDFTKAKEASQESLAETAQIIRQNME